MSIGVNLICEQTLNLKKSWVLGLGLGSKKYV